MCLLLLEVTLTLPEFLSGGKWSAVPFDKLGNWYRIPTPPGSEGVLFAEDPPLLPPLATPLMFAKSDLVRESGMVLLLLIDRGGVSFRLNFLALLTRLLPERLRPLRSG